MTERFVISINERYEITAHAGQPILDSMVAAGYKMRSSCRNGVCEICQLTLMQGSIIQRYPELDLSIEEGHKSSQVFACTAVPRSDIRVKIEGLLRPGELLVKKLVCDISAVEQLSDDVYRVRLHLPVTGRQAIEFHAGQYLEIILPDQRRAAFSIGSAPDFSSDVELHIRKIPDGEMSLAIMDHLLNNPSVEIELPKGDCYLEAGQLNPQTTIVLAAASTGFSQIKSMAEHLLANQVSNPIHIYWGARVEKDFYLEKLPLQWASEHTNVHVHLVVSEPGNSPGWAGRTGLLPTALVADFNSFDDVEIFTSGSPAMVYALLDACEEKGFEESHMHADVFAYAPRNK
ncbi:FAD-binding oxidoreductase [Amphritea balenae]|uniref:2', 3'-cyclic nucleotide 2'-phosphodiesterase n=1 Tax=Amphritea balenae TaxID=452629 RepID=A0A3P1SL12_9GAMM|nr:FAD-binding oxidoreductase [Amphritea balenae]RRC97425.1 2', 3'-cyclic nucleotide 2'-phosphodiesterase [Amphritea balenae]GGK84313.1 CDP-6-deoxy-delta-3,4-glucoseen reductase [Amphritea balenae]